MARKRVRLGELLREKKLISEEQLAEALVEQKRTGRKLGRVLTKKPIVPEAREIHDNPRARSAQFRVFETLGA